jgi:hypothetical protein
VSTVLFVNATRLKRPDPFLAQHAKTSYAQD